MGEQYFAELLKNREESLEHHGVLGQKWGIRRYQNKDGSLTAEGKKRVSEGTEGVRKVLEKGQSQVIRKRTVGDIASGASMLGTMAGTTAAGAAIGSAAAGPLGTIAGGATGYLAGIPIGAAVGYFVKKHADVKANALEDQYRLLGQKMMAEVGNTKVTDIAPAQTDTKLVSKQTSDSKTEEFIRKNAKEPTWAPDELEFDTKGGYDKKGNIHVNMNVGLDHENEASMIKAATGLTDHVSNKENISKIKDAVVDNMMNDEWNKSDATKAELKNNLKVYGMYIAMVKGDTAIGEINCEHENYDSKAAPYGDHSIDVDFTYDMKTKKITLDKNNSING